MQFKRTSRALYDWVLFGVFLKVLFRFHSDRVLSRIFSNRALLEEFSAIEDSRDVVVITTVQLHSTKPELRFCTEPKSFSLIRKNIDY